VPILYKVLLTLMIQDFKYYNFWFPVDWGCNMTSTAPTVMTSRMPTVAPTISPSHMPTNLISTVLPTMSPSDMPTDSLAPSTLPTVSPTQFPTKTNDAKDFMMTRVTELLGAVIVFLLIALIFLSFWVRKRKKTQMEAMDSEVKQVCSLAGDVRYALDEVSSPEGTIRDDPGGLQIWRQDYPI